jgi:hypothetical protein
VWARLHPHFKAIRQLRPTTEIDGFLDHRKRHPGWTALLISVQP